MRLSLLLTLAACGLLSSTTSAGDRPSKSAEADRVFQVETVKPGELLDIDLETGGGLHIAAWDRNQVRIASEPLEGCPDAVLSFVRTPRGVLLKTEYEKGSGDVHHCSFGIEIMVPRRFDVRIRSAGGEVSIANVSGRFEGKTGGGQLQLRGLKGEATLSTGGGQIRVVDSDLDGRLSTGGGQVRFENVVGDLSASSGSRSGVVHAKPRRR